MWRQTSTIENRRYVNGGLKHRRVDIIIIQYFGQIHYRDYEILTLYVLSGLQ